MKQLYMKTWNPLLSAFTGLKSLSRTLVIAAIALMPSVTKAQSLINVYDSAGTFTWTAPAGVTSIFVETWGGGGAGGGNTFVDNAGGGGGGGAYTAKQITVVPGQTYTLHVGKGGVGTTGDGPNGEPSWFKDSATLYADFGRGGKAPQGAFPDTTGIGGIGGAASPGFLSYKGGDGANGGTSIAPFAPAGGGGGGSSAGTFAAGNNGVPPPLPVVQAIGGYGGIAPQGGGYGGDGGGYDNPNGLLTGNPGRRPGGGGGGGGNPPPFQPVLVANGGNGANGRVVITTGQVYTQTSSWTAPSCINSVVVEAWGGGGGGGGNETTEDGGGGGGGGAYSRSTVIVVPGQTYAVTVGKGGVGVKGGNGTSGGDSWFKNTTTLLAKGGLGGYAPAGDSAGLPGLGGQDTAGVGTIRYSGGDGGFGNNSGVGFGGGGGSSAGISAAGNDGQNAAIFATVFVPARGGEAPNGGGSGGDGQNSILSRIGQSGLAPGGGGGGSTDIEFDPIEGGFGADGRIILSYPSASLVIGNNPVPAGNICASGVNIPVHSFTLSGANGCSTETDIRFTTTGTYTSGEILNFKLYYTTTPTFATTNFLTSTTITTGPGSHGFPSIVRPTGGGTYYYWITVDVAGVVTDGNTLAVNGTTPADITASPTPTGSGSASGTQTLKAGPKLSSPLASGSICSGTSFTYTPTSVSASPTFTWTRATVSGITEAGTSGNGPVNETLTNTTSAPINVTYKYVTSSPSNPCTNTTGESVVVTVNPSPQGSVKGNSRCGADPASEGQLTWTATAGTGPFNIIYNPGAVTKTGATSGTSFSVNPNPAVTTTYTITSVTDANGCVRTSGFTVDTASIIVTSDPIAITQHPSDSLACEGGEAEFTVVATGVFAYGWEVSTNNGGTWNNVTTAPAPQPVYSNTNSPSLKLSSISLAHNGYVYRAALSPACGPVVTNSNTATLTITPQPVLSSSTATQTICSGNSFTYNPTSASADSSFTWTRAAVAGITEPANTGNGNINEVLTNTTNTAINVTYNVVTQAGDCQNLTGENVVVTVNPSPKLTSTTTPAAICGGDEFFYTPTTLALDSSFTWTRATVPGINEPGTSGNDTIQEVLTNNTTSSIDVIYVVVAKSAECPAGSAGENVTVKVDPSATLVLTSAAGTDSLSVCLNSPITNITYQAGGSAVNVTASNLPPGVVGNFNSGTGVYTISGSVSVSGVYDYTVTTIGNCTQDTAYGTIVAGISLINTPGNGSDYQEVCLNTPITDIKYAIGGAGQCATVTGKLPAGVTFSCVNGVLTITGTPTEAGGFKYAITSTGTCSAPAVNGEIVVGIALISANGTDAQKVCSGTAISNISYKIVGGDSPAPTVKGLPPGLTYSVTSPGIFTIIGTPTIEGSYDYTVTAGGSCATKAWLAGNIVVTVGRVSIKGTDSQSVCKNTPIQPIVYHIQGGGTYTIQGLPKGLSVSPASPLASGTTFTITGTPTVEGKFTYTVSSSGTCGGASAKVKGTIISGIGLISAIKSDSQLVCINTPIDTILYKIVGGDAPTPIVKGLPTGFTTSFKSPGIFMITGTPSKAGLITYTITANGTCGSGANSKLVGKIAVGIGLISAKGTDSTQTVCKNSSSLVKISYTVVGGGTTKVVGLPPGLTGAKDPLNATVFNITGTPTTAGTYTFVVTNTGGTCASAAVGGVIVIQEARVDSTSESGALKQTICWNKPINTVILKAAGTGTGLSWSTLPSGLTGIYNGPSKTLTISGTPDTTVADGVYTVTITTTGGACTAGTTVFKLTVLNPIADFTADSVIGTAPLLVNFTNNSLNSNTYNWSLGDGYSSDAETPSNGYNKPGIYPVTLIASNLNRCPDTTTVSILVKVASIVKPPATVFTPNNDFVNDYFTINGPDLTDIDVEIYNRWGQLVYEWHGNLLGRWDGKNIKNGLDCPDGTYYYIFTAKAANGKEVTDKGFVNLLR